MPPSPSRDEARAVAIAAADLDDRHACRERVLDALTEIMKFETDPAFAKVAQRRFLDLTKGSLPA